MNDDKWSDVVEKIREKFKVEQHDKMAHPDISSGQIETLIFISPVGRYKLVRTTTPRVIDKKTVYSSRAGSSTSVQYEYDEKEMTSRLDIYKWDDGLGNWEKAEIEF